MKKVIAFILTIVIVLGMALPAGAAGAEDEDAVVTADGIDLEHWYDRDVATAGNSTLGFYPSFDYPGTTAYIDAGKAATPVFNHTGSTILALKSAIEAVGDRAKEVDVSVMNVADRHDNVNTIGVNIKSNMVDVYDKVRTAALKPGYTWSPARDNLMIPIVDGNAMKNKQIFSDVPVGRWYTEAINAMSEGGLLKGKGDNKFDPEAPITMGELCTIIDRLFDTKTKMKSVAYQDDYFDDGSYLKAEEPTGFWSLNYYKHETDRIWCWRAIIFCTFGLGSGYIRTSPEFFTQPATRGEAIGALGSMVGQYGANYNLVPINPETDVPDWDKADVGGVYIPGVSFAPSSPYYSCNDHQPLIVYHMWRPSSVRDAYTMGLVHGQDAAGTCNPGATLTRAELCQMLYNAGLTEAGLLTANQIFI